jgi:hypothetical protein
MRLIDRFSLTSLRSLWRDRRANALMITALALPFVIGAAGVGVHSIELTLIKRELQREADSAALAGAYSLYQGQTNTTATDAANQAITQNNLVPNPSKTITPGAYTSGGTTYSSAMYVRLQTTVSTPFMAYFGQGSKTVVSEARAATVPEGSFCFFAKESTATTGVTFAGNSNTDLGCGVATNSTNSSQAIRVNGSPTVTASPLIAMGTVEDSAAYAAGTITMSNHTQLTDPFAGLSLDPTSSGNSVNGVSCKTGSNWNIINVASGTTLDMSSTHGGCFDTINVQGTLTLGSGVYYLIGSGNNAGLSVGAQGHLTCLECTFVLTTTTSPSANNFSQNVAQISINGGAEIDLSASTSTVSSTYQGITVYRDSRVTTNSSFNINGNSSSSIEGAWYFPKDTLNFNGTAGMSLTCFQMVANNLSFSGDATINNTCTNAPPGTWSITSVRLIA